MPSSRIIKQTKISNSFRVNKIKGTFDYQNEIVGETFDVNIPIENKDWNIGLIVGSSGSGKTTIAKNIFTDFYFFNGFSWKEPSLVDDFPQNCSVEDITKSLNAVGLSCVPDWLKPFNVLSNGQKMRAELARIFFETDKPIIYDEFTSVVDREVAKVTSYVISNYVRKNNKKFIAVSCHSDIIDWLNPNWIYNTDLNEFKWRCLRRRPEIKIRIRTGNHKEWGIFSRYHYLNTEHNNSAKVFIAELNNKPVGFLSLCFMPLSKFKTYRCHRLVVLPDYQGLGIGSSILNFVGEYLYKKLGCRLLLVTSLAFLAKSISKNKKWSLTRRGHAKPYTTGKICENVVRQEIMSSFNASASTNRYTWSLFYNPNKSNK